MASEETIQTLRNQISEISAELLNTQKTADATSDSAMLCQAELERRLASKENELMEAHGEKVGE